MKAKLLIRNTNKEEMQVKLDKAQQTTLGRSRKCLVPINDVRLSRIHCVVFYHNEHFYIQDNNSTNGTYVNERNIDTPKRLEHSTTINIGGTQITYIENDQSVKNKSVPSEKIGPYRLLEKIGKGGIGAVYKVQKDDTDEIYALKILKPEVAEDEKIVARFIKEARVTAILDHPSIVKTIDMGVYKSEPYIVLEYLPDPSLSEVVHKKRKISLEQTLLIIEQIASALVCSHKQGVIHRDIKPSNILVSDKWHAKLIDMGLVKVIHESGLTLSGQAMGTPRYMSPEQILDSKSVDPRTDIYALGATMYYCICGKPPYYDVHDKRIASLLKKIYDSSPAPISSVIEVPNVIEELIDKSMARNPGDRFRSAKSFYKAVYKIRKKMFSESD
ncbi:protein kinase [Candidatus Uabimicrobium sp. HlEnr_7]|uniref:protein kinase domain-containing protein n=1 Tax=Candidatus Uabimicrobium helgolandensis TaxID=3095367 RepID=UPI003557884B